MIYHGGSTPLSEGFSELSNFAILRVQKLKSAISVNRSLKHAFRDQETPNANAELHSENSAFFSESRTDALAKYADRLPVKIRKNAVHCIEYLLTASPEAMQQKNRQEQDAYFEDAIAWLQAKHGAENVIHAGIHRDETTPHLYAYVVPIDAKGALNCRAFLGGAKALSDMQSDFALKVGQKHQLSRGLQGSKAKHTTIQQYYAKLQTAEKIIENVTNSITITPDEIKPLAVNTHRGKIMDWISPHAETEAGISHRLNMKIKPVVHELTASLIGTTAQCKRLEEHVKHLANGGRAYNELTRLLNVSQKTQLNEFAEHLREQTRQTLQRKPKSRSR